MIDPLLLAESLYRPPFDLGWSLLFFFIVLAALIFVVRRERTRWTPALRLLGLAGLAYLLLGPSATEPVPPTDSQPPRLAVLADTSASMAQMDAAADAEDAPTSRIQAVADAWLNDERLNELRQVADVEIVWFDEHARAMTDDPLKPNGQATHLIDMLSQVNADATLILSDGHDTTPRRPADFTKSMHRAGRVFAVPVGAPRSSPDLALQAWPTSDRLFEDQTTTITIAWSQRGLDGRAAVIELLHNGEVIDRQPITLDQSSAEQAFEVAPELPAGQTVAAHHYRARITLADGDEAYPDNNAEDLFIQVSRGRVKVLLIEGEPYWDTRSLARLVGSHPRFELTAVYGFGEVRRSRIFGGSIDPGTDPTLDLSPFDIVVLGRRAERRVQPGFARALIKHVRNGGAVVFARGQPFSQDNSHGRELLEAIEPISPVAWAEPVVGDMRVRLGESTDARGPLTDLGDSAVLSRLPGMLAATRIEGRKTASLVLLEQSASDEGPALAALTTLRVGSGVVMAVLTEGLWRWELLPGVGDDAQAESVYGVFWVRAMQWLASGGAFLPGQDIALEADRLGIEPGEAVTLTVSTRYIETEDLDLQLQAIDNTGKTQQLELEPGQTPGRYAASFTPTDPGVYTFELSAPGRDDLIEPDRPLATRLAVVERSAERRDTSARPDVLKRLTEPTGGRCLGLDESRPLLDYLQSLQVLDGPQPRVDYDFNTWPVFAWIAGCFGLEWMLRRRSGLR